MISSYELEPILINVHNKQAGIMEEMLEETLEMDEDDEIEEEADAEVDKVLFELTDGKLGLAGAPGTELPVRHIQTVYYFPTVPTIDTDTSGQAGRRRDRENYGTISTTTKRTAKRIKNRKIFTFRADFHLGL